MERITVVGIDLAKNVFEVCGRGQQGRIVLRRELRRKQLERFVHELPACLIGMEACSGAHEWGRRFRAMGHEVKLISPQFVRPYVKSNKTDAADAEAISEAVTRPTMRFVAIKSVEQQEVLSIHRVRERLVRQRTALINEIRGLLAEYGIVVAEGAPVIRRELPKILGVPPAALRSAMRELLEELHQELTEIDERIQTQDARIDRVYRASEICQRLGQIPGIGPITATALMATVGDARVFRCGREFSASLGLVPRQHSSGGHPRLGGISKRGDRYLRKLLVHGARAVLRYSAGQADRLRTWVWSVSQRRGWNKATVALANKNARVAWRLMATGESYQAA